MEISRAADLLAVLSHEKRFSLIIALAGAGDAGLTVAELAKRTDMTPRAVRNQMRQLAGSGLASMEKLDGQFHCSVKRQEISAFVNLISSVLGAKNALPSPETISDHPEEERHKVPARTTSSSKRKLPTPRRRSSYKSLKDRLDEVEAAIDLG